MRDKLDGQHEGFMANPLRLSGDCIYKS